MRLFVLPDLHLDHRPDRSMPKAFPDHDGAVIAGDVGGPPLSAMRDLARLPGLAGTPTIYGAGNHEFRVGHIEARLGEARMHLLDRDAVVTRGVRFVGTTLWSAYDPAAPETAEGVVNDRRLIDGWTIGVVITRQGRADGARDAARRRDGHRHAPCAEPPVDPPEMRGSEAYGAFASDCEARIRRCRPAPRVHATCDPFDYRTADMRVLCNRKGCGPRARLPRIEEDEASKPTLAVEI